MEAIAEQFGLTTDEDFKSLKDVTYDLLLKKYKEKSIIKVLQFDNHVENENENFSKCDKKFQEYLTGIILKSELAQSMDGKSDFIIRQLFKAYLSNPQQLPDNTIVKAYERIWESKEVDTNDLISPKEVKPYMARGYIEDILKNENNFVNTIVLRTVCDFIAGMTDQYAMDQFDRLYGTQKFKNY
jgi:dGTPase